MAENPSFTAYGRKEAEALGIVEIASCSTKGRKLVDKGLLSGEDFSRGPERTPPC